MNAHTLRLLSDGMWEIGYFRPVAAAQATKQEFAWYALFRVRSVDTTIRLVSCLNGGSAPAVPVEPGSIVAVAIADEVPAAAAKRSRVKMGKWPKGGKGLG